MSIVGDINDPYGMGMFSKSGRITTEKNMIF
jgi:hypothetical protein